MPGPQTIKMRKLHCILLIIITVLGGCYYDVEEELYPPPANCDTTTVTYSSTVAGLLQSNGCISCHSGSAPSGNISLEGYNNVKNIAASGRLYGAISHAAGFSPMPQGGNKLSACNIEKIKAWIDAGTPNN